MNRIVISFLVLPLLASPIYAQVAGNNEVQEYASALQTAYEALQQGDLETARNALSGTSESLRGTPYRLLQRIAADENSRLSLNGQEIPKPEVRHALAILHPTKQCVAYVCDGGVVAIFDLSGGNGEPNRIVTSRQRPLTYGSFSGDGKSFAAGDTDGGITVWETNAWNEIAIYQKGTDPVRFVSLDNAGEKLLAETENGVVLWDLIAKKEIGKVADRYNFGTALCFSPNSAHFATGGAFSVQIHDAATGKLTRQIAHAPYTMQLCFSKNGKYIASGLRGSANKWLGVFDVDTGETVFDHAEHEKGITGLLFLDDDTCLLSTSADGFIKFWHVPSGIELLAINMGGSIYQPSSTADGSFILWNQRTGPGLFSTK